MQTAQGRFDWVFRSFESKSQHFFIKKSFFFSSVKKLHKVQNQFLPEPTVFYLPNLERCLHINNVDYKNENGVNDVIGTNEFRSNQYELNIMWHIIEEQPVISKSYSVELNNMKYFVKNSSIDVKSSIQLTFDVITQLSDVS